MTPRSVSSSRRLSSLAASPHLDRSRWVVGLRNLATHAVLALGVAATGGCGRPSPAQSTQAPPPAGGPRADGDPAMGTAAPAAEAPKDERGGLPRFSQPPGGTVQPAPVTPGTMPDRPHDESVPSAMAELAGLETQLATMLGVPDCANACRALRSMSRAAARVCEAGTDPPPSPAPPPRDPDCVAADTRLAKARSSVLAACGACPESR
jgi:hypothetical protein